MVFISYYSGNKYEICSNRLERSLRKFNLPYSIQEKESNYDKQRNISCKPYFVKTNLLKFRQPVCWIDADSEVIKYPTLLMDNGSNNINLQIYNWYADNNNHITRNNKNIPKNKLLASSGTFAFNYSQQSLELLDKWIYEMSNNPSIPDDQVLDKIFNDGNWSNKISYRWLPKSYNRMMRFPDWLKTEPIINNTETNACLIEK